MHATLPSFHGDGQHNPRWRVTRINEQTIAGQLDYKAMNTGSANGFLVNSLERNMECTVTAGAVAMHCLN
jgi:hypothetical protein